MDRSEFIKQLNALHENDEHQVIVEAVENTPRNTWDFEISGLYARALNNLERYDEAMDQLFMFREEGEKNGVWNFRVGYSLYYLNSEEEAAAYFERAIEFGDDCDDTREMLRRSTVEAIMKTLLMHCITLLESGERKPQKIQEKFDEIMTAINGCRDYYYGDDEDIKETVKNMIYERVAAITDHFDLDIPVETLTKKLEA